MHKRLTLDHNSPVPLHAQLESALREMIGSAEFKRNEFLPNEVNLARQLGISRNTVRQAINKLVYDGLLIRKKGVGTQVADKSVNTKIQNWLSFSQEMKAKGIDIKNFYLAIDWMEADRDVAAFFQINEGRKVLKMERIRGKEDFPFVYFVSYFHPRIGLTGEEDFTRPLYDILEKDYSVIVKLSKEEISAAVADQDIAKKLNLNRGAAVLKRKRFVFDPGGRPVEYNLGIYRADSFIYTIESERKL
ncbi:MAG: GntR family transcriptional regulator [Bacteroidota bacterium]|nr:GntR family transcriptional regulator [Bacteroidota bacterium]